VNAQVVAIEAAVRPGADIVFSLGSTMRLISSAMTQGTQVQSFSWLPGFDGARGSGAEGILRRTFHLVMYGDNIVTSDTDLMSWQETLSATGDGGPRIVPVGSLNGLVQAQQVQSFTPYFATQSGFAVGLTNYPFSPLPLYAGQPNVFYFPESANIALVSPKSLGINLNTGYGIRWSFRCWSPFPLLGTPILPL